MNEPITAKSLEAELGRAEAIGQFVAQCVVSINQFEPELDYRHADLDGFVKGCWPCEGTPDDVAADFVSKLPIE